jgi:nicotinate-nucleotide adenylyltransferase
MKIGLYFGSFNPIHIGHLIIANHIINVTPYQKIWFVVSPQNPLKESKSLLNEYERLHLVQIAVEDDNNLKACDIEFKLPKPSYTISTLTYLKNDFPNNEFAIIMGSDSFQNFQKWRNYDQLIKDNIIIVYQRQGFSIKQEFENQLVIQNAPLIEISATTIRNLIKYGKSIRYLVPDKVREEIGRGRYYKT